jgi:hypothetical protein
LQQKSTAVRRINVTHKSECFQGAKYARPEKIPEKDYNILIIIFIFLIKYIIEAMVY